MRRHPSFATRAEAGLTLIELIVAVALLAVLTIMAYRGLDSVTRASDRTLAESEHWRNISMFFNRLGADVSQATRRPVRSGDDLLVPEWLGQALTAENGGAVADDKVNAQIEFTRKSPLGSDETRLGYRLRDTRVELLIWRVLDRAPTSVPDIHPLLEGVKTLRFSHLDKDGAWRDTWPLADKTQVLPRAIAVELTLTDGMILHRVFALP